MWRHQVVPGEVRAAQAWGRLMGVDLCQEPEPTMPRAQVAPPPRGARANRGRQLRRRARLRLRLVARAMQRCLQAWVRRLTA